MTEKFELASPQWMDAVHAALKQIIADASDELAMSNWSYCEVFTNVPDHITQGGGHSASFWYRLVKGELQFGLGEVDDVNFKVTAYYSTILEFAGGLPQNDEAAKKQYREKFNCAILEGRLQIQGTRDGEPEALGALNGEMEKRTAYPTSI